VGVRIQRTNLILDHGVADVVDQATKLLRILDVVEETLDLALLCQWLEFSGNVFSFLMIHVCQTGSRYWRVQAYRSRIFSWIFP
jgi:hypothetical protein